MSLIVKKEDTKSRPFSVRIPAQLASDLDALRTEADRRGYTLDASAVVVAALQKAVKEARSELAKAEQQHDDNQQIGG